jgi:leucyl-tRNA synthetase
MYGHQDGLAAATWPTYDPEVAKAELLVIPVQVNGKLRGRISAAPGSPDAELERLALADANVRAHTGDKTIRKVVIAKDRLVSIVVG